MSRSPLINYTIVDAAGLPVPGGLLYTFASDGTTAKATYSDAAKTVPNTNPVVANAAGVVGDLYLTDNELYVFVEKTAAGVTLRSTDPFYSGMLTNSVFATRIAQITSNPLDEGAAGDGLTDDSAALQDAIDGTTGTLDGLGKTYRSDAALDFSGFSGKKLRNITIDFTGLPCTDDALIYAHGTLGDNTLLTANGDYDDAVLSCTAVTGFAARDILCVHATDTYAGAGTNRIGELVEVESISVLDVSLQDAVMDDYTVANAAAAQEVNTVKDIVFEDVTIIGAEGIAGNTHLVSLMNCQRIKFSRCVFRGIDAYGLYMGGCYDVVVENCTIQDGAWGVMIGGACKYIRFDNCRFSGLNYAISIGGPKPTLAAQGIPRFVEVNDCQLNGSLAAAELIQIYASAEFVTLDGNTLRRNHSVASVLIDADCINLTIRNNKLRGISSGALCTGISLDTCVPLKTGRNYSLVISGNDIVCDGPGVDVAPVQIVGGSGTIEKMEITGNEIHGQVAGNASVEVYYDGAALRPPITELVVCENTCSGDADVQTRLSAITRLRMHNNTFAGIYLLGGTAVGYLAVADLADNICADTFTVGHIPTLLVKGGRTTGALSFDDVQSIVLNDHDAEGGSIIDNTNYETDITITGGRFAGVGVQGLELDLSDATGSRFSIVGASIAADTGDALEVTGVVNSGLISSCYVFVSGGGDCIELAGDAANALNNIHVTGCTIQGGTFGIDLSNNSATCHQFDNNFISCGADTDGTFATRDLYINNLYGGTAELTGNLQANIHYVETYIGLDGVAGSIRLDAVRVQVTNAEMLTLTGGKTLIVGTAGKAHYPIFIVFYYYYDGANAFVEPSAPDDMEIEYVGGITISGVIDGTYITGAGSARFIIPVNGPLFSAGAEHTNEGIRLINNGNNYTCAGGATSCVYIDIIYITT